MTARKGGYGGRSHARNVLMLNKRRRRVLAASASTARADFCVVKKISKANELYKQEII